MSFTSVFKHFFVVQLMIVYFLLSIQTVKCCSPCCAPCLNAVQKAVFFLLKAPFLLVMWCVGRATEDDEEKQELPKHAAEYGTSEPDKTTGETVDTSGT